MPLSCLSKQQHTAGLVQRRALLSLCFGQAAPPCMPQRRCRGYAEGSPLSPHFTLLMRKRGICLRPLPPDHRAE